MKEPYVKVPLSILYARLKPESKLMLVLFINHENMNGDSFLTKPIKWYEETLSLTEREVRSALKELEENGLLDKKSGHTNSYRLSEIDELSSDIMSRSSDIMSRCPDNMSRSSDNMSRLHDNMSRPYTLIVKENKKEYLKQISKSARAREREEYQFSPDLFDGKRKAD